MSTGCDPHELRELLAAYALDAVDDVERRSVERLVAQDESVARELASLRGVTTLLAVAVASPPSDGLRAAVLAEVATTPQVAGDGARVTPPQSTRAPGRSEVRRPAAQSRLTRLPVGIAAAAVAAVAAPTVVAWREHDRAVVAEARAELLGDVLADPGTQVLRGAVTGGGDAVAVLGAKRAVLLTGGLPDVAEGRTYELWAMRDGVPVPAGLLEVTDGRVEVFAEDYRAGDGLAVSVEPDGGSDQPTTEPVLVLLPG